MLTTPRVMLHAMTLYRDAPMMVILKNLLERMGCKVMISSVRNYVRIMQAWRPHAILYGTLSKTPVYLKYAPYAKLFYCPGEGGESVDFMDESLFLEHEEYFDVLTRVYVWGQKTIEHLLGSCLKQGKQNLHDKISNGDKVICNGHPRLDMIRFLPSRANCQPRTVGINTNLNRINSFSFRSALWYLLDTEDNLAWVEREVREAVVIQKLITHVLTETDHKLSIRPYPLEDRSIYLDVLSKNVGVKGDKLIQRIHVDNTLDYGSWLRELDVVVSRVSTTVNESALIGVPHILIDRLAENEDFYLSRSHVESLLIRSSYLPSTYDELFHAILKPESIPGAAPKLEEFWRDYYGQGMKGSALLRLAKDICNEVKQEKHNLRALLPRSVLGIWDYIRFRQCCRAELTHKFFSYQERFHKAPEYYGDIADAIYSCDGGQCND